MWETDSAGRWTKRLVHLREDLEHFILPERRDRTYPWAVKLKVSNYPRRRPALVTGIGASGDEFERTPVAVLGCELINYHRLQTLIHIRHIS